MDNNIHFVWEKGLFYGCNLLFSVFLTVCLHFLGKPLENTVNLNLDIWFWKLIYIMQTIRKYLSRNLIYFSHGENVPNSRETFQEIISFYTHSVIIFLSDWHCRISQKHYSTEMVAVGVCVWFQGRRKKTTTAYPLLTTNLYQALWNQISFLCE